MPRFLPVLKPLGFKHIISESTQNWHRWHRIDHQWKVQQWPQDCKKSAFIPVTKKGNAKECSKKERKKVKSLSRAWLFATPWIVACTKLLCPWDFQGKSTGVGWHFLLQGIFPTQGWNPSLSHCGQTLYHLSHRGSPREELGDFNTHLHQWIDHHPERNKPTLVDKST